MTARSPLPVRTLTSEHILVGTSLAAVLTFNVVSPEPPARQAALLVGSLSAILTAGIAHTVWKGHMRERPAGLAVRAGLIYWLLLPAVNASLGGTNLFSKSVFVYRYARFTTSPRDASESLALILAFYLAFLVLERYSSVIRQSDPLPPSPTEGAEVMRQIRSSVVAIGFGYLIYLAMAGGNPLRLGELVLLGRTGETPWQASGIHGNKLTTARNLAIGLMVAGSASSLVLSVLYRHLTTRRLRRQLALLSSFAIATVVVESGTRNQMALGVLPPVLALLTLGPNRYLVSPRTGPTHRRRLVAVVILIPTLLLLSSVIRTFRTASDPAGPSLSVDLDTNDNDFFSATMVATGITRTQGSQLESPLALSVIQLVPNGLWPGHKPYSPSTVRFSIAKWGRDPRTGTSQAFGSIVGQYYMAYGVAGPLVAGLMYGGATEAIDRRIRRRPSATTGVPFAISAFLFISFRGFFGAFGIASLVTVGIALAARSGKYADATFDHRTRHSRLGQPGVPRVGRSNRPGGHHSALPLLTTQGRRGG